MTIKFMDILNENKNEPTKEKNIVTRYKGWEITRIATVKPKGNGISNNGELVKRYRWSAEKGDKQLRGYPSLASLKEEIDELSLE